MKTFVFICLTAVCFFTASANADDSPLKVSFMEACSSSPHIDEGSNCMCVFNEVIHKFGEEDAKELIPFITGDQEMEKDIGDSLNFIAGKCEG